MQPRFFATPATWRAWLGKNHETRDELWVGFYKRDSGRPSITWPESVDGALCFGWIDGVRRSLGTESYVIRFTPRRKGSIWSNVNTRRMKELIAEGLVASAGLRAFERRTDARSGIYAFEQRATARLTPAQQRVFKATPAAWKYYQAQAPWYRRTTAWWIISAKKEDTRERRLRTLIECSAVGKSISPLLRAKEPKG